jgi:hypothetical protein
VLLGTGGVVAEAVGPPVGFTLGVGAAEDAVDATGAVGAVDAVGVTGATLDATGAAGPVGVVDGMLVALGVKGFVVAGVSGVPSDSLQAMLTAPNRQKDATQKRCW